MDKKLVFILKFIVTLILFYLIFLKIDLTEFFSAIKEANIYFFIIPILLWPISLLISSARFKLILEHYKIKVSQKESFNLNWVGSFFNNFFPSSFGGDGYKFFILNKKTKGKKAKILSSILMDRGNGFIAIAIFGAIFGLWFIKEIKINPAILMLYLISVFIILIILAYSFLFSGKSIKIKFSLAIINKVKSLLNEVNSFYDKRRFFISLIYSLIYVFLSILSQYFLFRAFNYNISFLLLLFLIPLIYFSDLIPVSLNSLGVREGVAIYLFLLFGINSAVVLSVFLVGRILLILCSLTGGLKYSIK